MPSPVAMSGLVIDSADAARGHQGHAREEGVDLAGLLVEHIGTIALNVAGAAGDDAPQVVLGENLDSEVVLKDVDILVGLDRLDQRRLYLVSRVVGVMEDAELAVPALTMQVEVALLVLVELHAPVDERLDLLGGLGDHLLDRLGVAEPVASHHGVVDVFVEVVDQQVGDTCHTALCQVGVGLVEGALADERYGACLGDLEGKTHTSHARADDEVIIMTFHSTYI